MSLGNVFYEIAAILGLATLLGIIGHKLRQPLIIMFLATGILAGPSFLGIIESHDQLALLAHIGIALLLFIVGLRLDLNLIRVIGPVALATGIGQIVFTSAIGFLIAVGIGMSTINAAYVSVALTFSSTIIIVKLLSDKKEIDSLHGQIAVGFLIVQDIAAILALVALTTLGSRVSGTESAFDSALVIAVKGIGFLGVVALLTRFIIPGLVRRLAYSQELLALFAVAWAVLLGTASDLLGFSKEVGAFLAGVSLASTDYRDSIGARLTSLRDFLLLFFFIDLGARLDWSAVGSQLGAAALFSLFVLIGNPIIVMVIMGVMGYRRRTGFMAGLAVAQISEFSLIVVALGLSIGHVTPETVGLVTLVGVVTICVSTYMILYSAPLYDLLSEPLRIFERHDPFRETAVDSGHITPAVDVILMGLGNYGSGLAEHLLRRGKTILGVDFDPTVLETWRSRGISVLYGDVANPEIHGQLPLNNARWIVSTVRSADLNLALIRELKNHEFAGRVALTATNQAEADLFEKNGAQIVFRPFKDAAEQAADALTHAMDVLPENIDWPIAFREVRMQSGSAFSGRTIRDIPLGSTTGLSIMAVSRGGRVHFDLEPEFQVYPGDRLVIMGTPEDLLQAETLLNQFHAYDTTDEENRFMIAEVKIGGESPRAGKTLSDLQIRQKHKVTVVGIKRGQTRIMTPGPTESLAVGDCLILIGSKKAVEAVKQNQPL